MTEASQAWLAAFGQWLGAQQAAMRDAVPTQGDGASPLESLRREFAARHMQLWQAELERKPGDAPPAIALPGAQDRRFTAPEWSQNPAYDYLRQAYLLNAEFLRRWAALMPIGDEALRRRVEFFARQLADALAPTNFAATNPEFIKQALDTQGRSITEGVANLIEDLHKRSISTSLPGAFELGRNVATTPGAVVFENPLMQLIQFAPATSRIATRPLLIVPPCINKYYVLDLQRENSFVRYCVEQGNTVFVVSWVNPKSEQGALTWDDYLEQGVLTAIDVVREICAVKQVNALGFCIGGTLLASALAVARARGDKPAASLTLLTTLLDYGDPGDIGCFIDDASIKAREAAIGEGGLLRGFELAAVFSSLRANDLIWPYVVGNYLKGGKPPAFDLLHWNADSTNLPGPFAVWYLRRLYLENKLVQPNALSLCGVDIDLGRLDMPAFIYASREDHIVPWKAAYASRRLLGGETTFVLGASGHIAGVVNPPEKHRRSYWSSEQDGSDADAWLASAQETKGSWWPHWARWLRGYGGRQRAARLELGSAKHPAIEPAPGRYVREPA